jgi:arylsulfatase A-like enzyme
VRRAAHHEAAGAHPRRARRERRDAARSRGRLRRSRETPAFDRFARENLYFDAAFSQAPWTIPSITTLFTSLYPSQHGMQTEVGGSREALLLPDSLTTLAEVFRGAG